MFRSATLSLGLAVALIAALATLAGASSASAANVVNGSFETGTLEGWNVYASNSKVEWIIVGGEEALPPPFDGRDAAFSEWHGPGTTILYQDVALPLAATDLLQMTFTYSSEASIAIPQPDSLDAEGAAENQQVRVDVVKPTAPIDSVAPGDVLATMFAATESENDTGGEEPSLEPKRLGLNLSAFAGQTVRLRVAVAASRKSLSAGIDAVSITSTPILAHAPVPSLPPTPFPPSNQIQKGKLTLNKKHGTARLAITAPGAGTLTVIDASTKVAIASMTNKGGRKPAMIRTRKLRPSAAGTIEVPIKPTASGRRVLEEKGRLAIRARLTFTPTGGTAATQVYPAKLVKTLKARK